MTITRKPEERWPDSWVDGAPSETRFSEYFINEVNDDVFHVGQIYQLEAAKAIECKKCGSREFNVGVGNYFTAIRCVKCEWEVCIHEG